MAVKEIPQKLNFFVAGLLSILGLSLSSEIIMEDDPMDKVDDVLLLLLGLFSIYWYKKNANKFSAMPVILTLVALVIKIFAIVVEHGDAEAVGDDIGLVVTLVIASIVVIYQYLKLKKAS